jgi:hypothetical protein
VEALEGKVAVEGLEGGLVGNLGKVKVSVVVKLKVTIADRALRSQTGLPPAAESHRLGLASSIIIKNAILLISRI